jgi:hypothetical protein
LPAPLPVAATDGRGDSHLVQFVWEYEQGVVSIGRYVELADCIAQIAIAYPVTDLFRTRNSPCDTEEDELDGCEVVVLGSKRAQLCSVARRLREHLGHVNVSLHLDSNAPTPTAPLVAVSTFMQAADLDLGKRAIVILLDATEITHVRAQYSLAAPATRGRLFGFLREGQHLAPSEWDAVFAAFGPAEVAVPAHGFGLAQVSVAWCRLDRPRVAGQSDIATIKQEGYTLHPARNRRVASLAKGLVTGDMDRLNCCPAVARWLGDRAGQPMRVTVLVEGLEHALALAPRLDGWPIIAGDGLYGAVNLGRRPRSDRRLLANRQSMWITGNRQIVTESVAEDLALAGPDVVIWAGGGQHLPPIPRPWLLRPAESDHSLLVIDCNDRHHRLLAEWTRERRGAYTEAGWFDVRVDPIIGRIERFLREPPRARQSSRRRQR